MQSHKGIWSSDPGKGLHWVYLDDLLKDIPRDTIVPCEPMDSKDMLFILYTSGSTGKPKGGGTRPGRLQRLASKRTFLNGLLTKNRSVDTRDMVR